MMWPLVVYFAFAVVLVTAVIGLSYLLGPRHLEPATGEPYEGGIVSEGSAHVRFSIRYSAVARILSTAGAQNLLAGLGQLTARTSSGFSPTLRSRTLGTSWWHFWRDPRCQRAQ